MEQVKLFSMQWDPISETAMRFEGSQDLSVYISKILKKTISFAMSVDCLSVRPSSWNNLNPTGRIFKKFDICVFFENSVTKIPVTLTSERNNGTLHKVDCILDRISLSSS